MPNGDPPPVCDPICQKIILDGDILGAVFGSTGERIAAQTKPLAPPPTEALSLAAQGAFGFINAVLPAIGHDPVDDDVSELDEAGTCARLAKLLDQTCKRIEKFGKPIPGAAGILDLLITAENDAFSFQRAALEGMGFQGPWPKCLA